MDAIPFRGIGTGLIDPLPPRSVFILGLRVHNVTMEETIARIEAFIASEKPALVITLGTEMVVASRGCERLRSLVNAASLVVPDGGGLLWASRRLGEPFREKVAGVELVEKLCAASAQKGWKLFFLGGKPGVAASAAERLLQKYPGTRIVGTQHGYAGDDETAPIIESAKPDILFAGMGFPKQEEWLLEHLSRFRIPVGIGVGGSFDVLSGRLKRAPGWMIRLNLEWLFRLLQEPRRLKRILKIPLFVMFILASRRAKKEEST